MNKASVDSVMPARQLRELFDRVLAAFQAGEVDEVARIVDELIDQDVVVHEPRSLPWGGEHHGLEGFKAVLGRVAPNVDLGSYNIHEIVGNDHFAVVYFTCLIRLADGTTFETHMSEHYTFRDAKVVEVRVFWADTAAVANVTFT